MRVCHAKNRRRLYDISKTLVLPAVYKMSFESLIERAHCLLVRAVAKRPIPIHTDRTLMNAEYSILREINRFIYIYFFFFENKPQDVLLSVRK